MPEKIEITRDTPLAFGDVIEIHFSTLSMVWIQAAHIALIERAIRNEEHFDLIRSNYTKNKIEITLKVIKNPAVTAGLIISAIVAISISLLIFLTTDKIYKIVSIPGDGGGGISSALWAVVAGLGVFAFLKVRK